MKYPVMLLTFCALALGSSFAAEEYEPGLELEIYNIGKDLREFPKLKGLKPAVKRIDRVINYTERGEPWEGCDFFENFYACWKGSINIPKAGKYKFFTESDDGSRVFIDGKMVVDNGEIHGPLEKSGEVGLTAGQHPLKVEYFQWIHGTGCVFSWQPEGMAKEVVPPNVLFHKNEEAAAQVAAAAQSAAKAKVEAQRPAPPPKPRVDEKFLAEWDEVLRGLLTAAIKGGKRIDSYLRIPTPDSPVGKYRVRSLDGDDLQVEVQGNPMSVSWKALSVHERAILIKQCAGEDDVKANLTAAVFLTADERREEANTFLGNAMLKDVAAAKAVESVLGMGKYGHALHGFSQGIEVLGGGTGIAFSAKCRSRG